MKTPNLDREINIYEIHKKQGYLTKDGENYLAEFKAIKQALTVSDVVGRSEQLEDFVKHIQEKYGRSLDMSAETLVEKYKSSN